MGVLTHAPVLKSSKTPMWCSFWCSGYIQSSRVQTLDSYTRSLPWTPTLPSCRLSPFKPLESSAEISHSSLQQYEVLLASQGWEGPPLLWSTNQISLFEGRCTWMSSLLKHLCWDTVYPFVLKDKYTLHHSQSGPLPFPKSNPVPFRTSPIPGLFFNPMHLLVCLYWICYCGFSYTRIYRVYDILGMAWFT